MSLIRFTRADYPLTQTTVSEALFAGELLVFAQLPAVQTLVELADRLLRSGFADAANADIGRVEWQTPAAPFRRRCADVQTAFQHSGEAKRHFIRILSQIGLDHRRTYLDKMGLRVVAAQASHLGRRLAGTAIHRDSWGANIYQQLNWWLPVYDLHHDNTLVIYPDYWQRAVANNSAQWSYDAYRTACRNTPDREPVGYPAAPTVQQPIALQHGLRIDIRPGELLCFSAAHLHGGLANTSGVTRVSIETRSVHQEDIDAGRSAPDIDGHYPGTHPGWFRHAVSNRPLDRV